MNSFLFARQPGRHAQCAAVRCGHQNTPRDLGVRSIIKGRARNRLTGIRTRCSPEPIRLQTQHIGYGCDSFKPHGLWSGPVLQPASQSRAIAETRHQWTACFGHGVAIWAARSNCSAFYATANFDGRTSWAVCAFSIVTSAIISCRRVGAASA
jgi:hypothetical protein